MALYAQRTGRVFAHPVAWSRLIKERGWRRPRLRVDSLFSSSQLRSVLAQVDVTFSNSLIEVWWRSLKHQWLYQYHLDSIATVRRLVGFHVRKHNVVMPHWAFDGLTPDEDSFGRTEGVVKNLEAGRVVARAERLKANQSVSCPNCPRSPPREGLEESAA